VTDTPALPLTGLTASLVLIRHGQSTWIAEGRFQGQADPPLSTLGEAQAARLAARLGGPRGTDPVPGAPPQRLWVSPLGRARATAANLAALPGWPPATTLDGLLEVAQGEWEGLPAGTVAERWAETLAGWRRDPTVHHAPGGEALLDVDRRVRAALTAILDDLRPPHTEPGEAAPPLGGSRVVTGERYSPVPGYGAAGVDRPWAAIVAHDGVLRLSLLALLGLPLGAFWRLPFVLCGLTVVTLDGGAAALRAHNLAQHLAGAGDGPEKARPGAL